MDNTSLLRAISGPTNENTREETGSWETLHPIAKSRYSAFEVYIKVAIRLAFGDSGHMNLAQTRVRRLGTTFWESKYFVQLLP